MSVEEINIEDANAYFCSKCAQKVSSSHQYFLYDLPECLIITLKRFVKTKDGYSKECKKIENELTINLSKFVLGGGVHTYKLSGFTSHGGSIYGGHYVSYCYNSEEYVL
jgi:ubiquitin C-terminal hydrolase